MERKPLIPASWQPWIAVGVLIALAALFFSGCSRGPTYAEALAVYEAEQRELDKQIEIERQTLKKIPEPDLRSLPAPEPPRLQRGREGQPDAFVQVPLPMSSDYEEIAKHNSQERAKYERALEEADRPLEKAVAEQLGRVRKAKAVVDSFH